MDVDAGPRQKGRGFRPRRGGGGDGADADADADAHRLGGGGAFDALPPSSGGGAGPGPARSVGGFVLFVTGLHEEAQEEDVADAFAEHGDVKSVCINLDRRTGYVKGYALVEFGEREEAAAAIAALDGRELLAKPVRVGWAFMTGPQRQRR